MKLLFKQRAFSWFDSYDVYDEDGRVLFSVEGRLAWGKKLEIHDASGALVGTLKQKVFTFFPTFELYIGDRFVGSIHKEFSLFKPTFSIDCNGWSIEGNWFEWDYRIYDYQGNMVANVSKQFFNWTDTYVLEVGEPANAVTVLMITLAIDAEKDSRN